MEKPSFLEFYEKSPVFQKLSPKAKARCKKFVKSGQYRTLQNKVVKSVVAACTKAATAKQKIVKGAKKSVKKLKQPKKQAKQAKKK